MFLWQNIVQTEKMITVRNVSIQRNRNAALGTASFLRVISIYYLLNKTIGMAFYH